MPKIVPAILTDNPAELEKMVRQTESFTGWAQLDFMDGLFVPSRSITPADVAMTRPQFQWEAHLMVQNPTERFGDLKNAGAQKVVFHYEATSDVAGTAGAARQHGLRVGLAINPGTPISAVHPLLSVVDSVLFLSVHPGFYGAPFIPEVLRKVVALRDTSPLTEICIDGGIKRENLLAVATTRVDFICVGSAIFRHHSPAQAFRDLQDLANQATSLRS